MGLVQGPKIQKSGGAHFEAPKNGPRKGQLPIFYFPT